MYAGNAGFFAPNMQPMGMPMGMMMIGVSMPGMWGAPMFQMMPQMMPQMGPPMPQIPPMPQMGPPMFQMPQVPAEVSAQLDKYRTKTVDKAIEKPNVIAINKPKLGQVVRPPKEALRVVLDSISPGFTENGSLFDQGLTSFNVMQLITRAGEQGYELTMRDVFSNPTFDGIASKMKAGE